MDDVCLRLKTIELVKSDVKSFLFVFFPRRSFYFIGGELNELRVSVEMHHLCK